MKRILALTTVLAMSLAASGVLLAQQESPFVGTWKLNLAKSKFTGRQPPKSGTRTEVAQGDGFKVTYEGITARKQVLLCGKQKLQPARYCIFVDLRAVAAQISLETCLPGAGAAPPSHRISTRAFGSLHENGTQLPAN